MLRDLTIAVGNWHKLKKKYVEKHSNTSLGNCQDIGDIEIHRSPKNMYTFKQ